MLSFTSLIGVVLTTSIAHAVILSQRSTCECTSSSIPPPTVFGAEIVAVNATTINDYGGTSGNDVCYVIVTLTHPGANDTVHNYVALPLSDWNGVFQGIGGGGYAAGTLSQLAPQTALGYSAATTDAGLNITSAASQDAGYWALISEGNVNQYALLDFASRSLHDLTVIGKAVSQSFYGAPVNRSYWNGCSTGGRQGMIFAQYYPDDYDGILADAPAIQWNDFTLAQQWPYTVESNEAYAPAPCEFDAVNAALISACDALDGLRDGIVSAPALCTFRVQSLVNQTYICDMDGSTRTFTQQTADVIDRIWQGATTPEGSFLWYGLIRGANFSSLAPNLPSSSKAVPFSVSDSWIRGFIAKNLTYDTSTITYAQFADVFLQSHIQYDSIIGTASPDLRPFASKGGKMITWQGLADGIINPQGTMLYHAKVAAIDPNIDDFYRQFYSPGVGHCGGGTGVTPSDPIGQLRAWVENGTAPDTLMAGGEYAVNASSGTAIDGSTKRTLDLCPYPAVNKYSGSGDPNLAASWDCVNGTGWELFAGPGGGNYSCVGGPGWYGR